MTREVRLVAALMVASVVLLLTGGRSFAAGPSDLGAIDVDTSHYPDVSLSFEVPDVVDGSWTATVVEDGAVRPASIQTGAHGGNEVVLVIDTSGSMAGAPLRAAKAASVAFVHQLPPATRVSVVGFGASPYVVSPMTSDPGVLEAAINGVRASGDTALYDALGLAVAQFSLTPAPRSIVLVSDGGDTTSVASLDEVTQRLVDARARVFGVRLVTGETNDGVLTRLASDTNGRTADTADPVSLTSTYQAIAASALRQVRLTYHSEAHGATGLEVRLAGPGVTRSGTASATMPTLAPTSAAHSAPDHATPHPTEAGTSRTPLVVGGTALFLALLYLSYAAVVRRPKSLLAGERRQLSRAELETMKSRLSAAFERVLERRGRRDGLSMKLDHAGMTVSPGEYLVMASVVVGIGWFIGLLLDGPFLAFLFGIAVGVGAWILLDVRASKRKTALDLQLPDFLQQLTSSLRAGYGVMQGLDAVARESQEPLRGELRRVVHEVHLGRTLTEALEAMATRVGGQDFDWVVQAIEINHEVGGDLVEVLEAVAATIRARAQLRRQVRTLSAQGRLTARILGLMPIILGLILSAMHPGWLSPLFTEPAGRVALGIGGALLVLGRVWMRRLVAVEY